MEKTIIGDFELVEYNGIYSLIAVREYNGNYYQQWCRIELGKEKRLSEKSQPVKIVLGTKKEAVARLNEAAEKILLRQAALEGDVPF